MNRIIVKQDDVTYIVEITKELHEHFGTDKIYAIINYYTGHLIYNLDYDQAKYEATIIITTT